MIQPYLFGCILDTAIICRLEMIFPRLKNDPHVTTKL